MNLGEVFFGLAGVVLGYRTLTTGASRLNSGLRGPKTTITRVPQRSLPPLMHQGPYVRTMAGTMRMTTRSVKTLDDRLAVIIDHAVKGRLDPRVMAWARNEITRKHANPSNHNGGQWRIPEKDAAAEIVAIHDGMRRSVRYTSDPVGADGYQTPARTLQLKTADCDDVASLGCAALMSIGRECRMVVIRTKNSPSWDHIWPEGKAGNRWIAMDASVPVKAGWSAPDSMIAEKRIFEVRP